MREGDTTDLSELGINFGVFGTNDQIIWLNLPDKIIAELNKV